MILAIQFHCEINKKDKFAKKQMNALLAEHDTCWMHNGIYMYI